MDIAYRNKRLKSVCTDYSAAKKAYGEQMAEMIHLRIDQISASESVQEMVRFNIGRCHRLKGDRDGKYACNLIQPYRLVFSVEGGRLQIARIEEIVDYH